ncbi:hypothetical protein [Nostoc sp. TCL240-02]|uniref:hypothetical protein n=1 Tax=Nostoc sp. TCL240-02 TaxID=2572090 RepID=UPI00157F8899|nr:hypothetical protein [Nostoc sp. TCL240-02]
MTEILNNSQIALANMGRDMNCSCMAIAIQVIFLQVFPSSQYGQHIFKSLVVQY